MHNIIFILKSTAVYMLVQTMQVFAETVTYFVVVHSITHLSSCSNHTMLGSIRNFMIRINTLQLNSLHCVELHQYCHRSVYNQNI